MEIKELTTSYIIKGAKNSPSILEKIIAAFSSKDYETEEPIRLGYLYDKENDTLRIPKISHSKLREFIPSFTITKTQPSEYQECFFSMVNQPKEIQKKVFDDIEKTYQSDTQVYCDMVTGSGKTYLGTYCIHKLKSKALIIAQTNKLREQWALDIMGHTDVKLKDIAIIESVAHFANDYSDKKIFICTHHNLRALIKINDGVVDPSDILDFNMWLINNGIGIKIFDEADLETASLFKIDLITNVSKTLYLSATRMKSIKDDDLVYQLAFHDVKKYGAEYFKDIVPNRDALLVEFNSKPGKLLYTKAMSFGNDFNNFKFCSYMMIHRPKIFLNLIDVMYKKFQEICEEDSKAKFVIYVSKKAYCFILKDMLIERWNRKDIGVVNSMVDKKFRDYNFGQKIIVTTIKSMGRGIDLKGMRCQFDSEIYSSESMFKQQVGRTGRIGALYGYYMGIYDLAYSYIFRTYMKKKALCKEVFNNTRAIRLETTPDYIPEDRAEIKEIENAFQKKWYKYLKQELEEKKKWKNKKQ